MKASNITLLRYQSSMLKTMGQIFLNSLKRKEVSIKNHRLVSHTHNVIPHKKLVEGYHKWLEVEKNYDGSIAPHLFPLWSYPHLFKLGEQLNLPLHKVLNQGCKLKINNDLPIDSPLNTTIEIFDVKDLPSKYRINQKITTGSKNSNKSIEAEIYAVILKNPKNIFKKLKKNKIYDTSEYTISDVMQIRKEDAQSYAYISGDMNPIHLSQNLAKLMGLKGSIMHGFGLFAMLFESLQKSQFILSEIDIKFLSPVYLGSVVEVIIKQISENKFSVRVISADHKTIHLSGEFLTK